MSIEQLLKDKSIKAKAKSKTIGDGLLKGSLSTKDLINTAEKVNDVEKATCIEALEYATKIRPGVADEKVYDYLTKCLTDAAPRIKWESAKTIGNIVHLFPARLGKTIPALLENSENSGTVVRWATAHALGEILVLQTKFNKELLPTMEAMAAKEEESGVKKKYLGAIKRLKNQSEQPGKKTK